MLQHQYLHLVLSYDRTISTDADAYLIWRFPWKCWSGMYIPGGGRAVSGTSGNDSVTITDSNGTVYFAGEGDDTLPRQQAEMLHFLEDLVTINL